jgi:hypothetical protein
MNLTRSPIDPVVFYGIAHTAQASLTAWYWYETNQHDYYVQPTNADSAEWPKCYSKLSDALAVFDLLVISSGGTL